MTDDDTVDAARRMVAHVASKLYERVANDEVLLPAEANELADELGQVVHALKH